VAPTPEDFSELIRLYGEKAYNFAFRLAGNEQDANDLLQEAFVRAFKNRHRYDPVRRFDSWLHRILHNIYLDSVKRYAHKHSVSLDVPMTPDGISWEEILPGRDSDPSDDLGRKETDSMVQSALNALPVHYRTALVLCDIEGLSYEEIAGIMACPVGTVRSRLHEGRALLKKIFEKNEKKGEKKGPAVGTVKIYE
jgi:RNA polymerase sigma-70 factor (ECF subfamily)